MPGAIKALRQAGAVYGDHDMLLVDAKLVSPPYGAECEQAKWAKAAKRSPRKWYYDIDFGKTRGGQEFVGQR